MNAKKAKAPTRKAAKKAVAIKKPAPKKKPTVATAIKKFAKKVVKSLVKKPVKKRASTAAIKKSGVKKSTAKKLPVKKPAVKKSSVKIAAKKIAPRKVAKKAAAKKIAPRKVAKKAVAKKIAPRNVAKKVVAKKSAPRNSAKKSAIKKITPRKAVAIKLAAKPVYHFEGPAAPQVKLILETLDDAKAENTIAINIAGRSAMADAMVITTGRVNRHVNAIADQLYSKLKSAGVKRIRIEGQEAGDWCLMDTGDVIIHIFRPEVRLFYNLEKLWSADAPKENV